MLTESDFITIKESLLALAPVALSSRHKQMSASIRDQNVLETLNKYFKVGTEKANGVQKYGCLCTLDHVPISDLPQSSMFSLGKEMLKKNH